MDLYWMKKALLLAKEAAAADEVPVGAILVRKNRILSSAFNLRESLLTPLAHAENLAIHRAAKKVKSWRLVDCTLYITLEPCPMCAGTILQARIPRVIFGAFDPKAGAVKSIFQLFQEPRLNHQVQFTGGVLENECSQILRDFFKLKRDKRKSNNRTNY